VIASRAARGRRDAKAQSSGFVPFVPVTGDGGSCDSGGGGSCDGGGGSSGG
jgi:hypothetical protein